MPDQSGRALWLLLFVGILTGLNSPLGKLAADAQVPALVWGVVVSGGAVLVLALWLAMSGRLIVPTGRARRYVVVAGCITFVGANLVLFTALPRLGAAQMGLMFALSPVFTLALSTLVGLGRPCALGVVGIVLGMFGAIGVALARGSAGQADLLWSLFGLLMPLLLAAGNVYRTLDWPDGRDPAVLAFWSNAVAAVVLSILGLAIVGPSGFAALAEVPQITVAQVMLSGITFPAFFWLQRLGGPVLLSQLGYVAAATGVLVAVLVLDETVGAAAWFGVALIIAGILCTSLDRLRQADRAKACPV